MTFYAIFLIGGIFCSVIISLILISRKRQNVLANCLLGIALLSAGWYFLCMLLIQSGLIRQFPYLVGSGIPLYYLVPPLCFLYVKSNLLHRKSLTGADFLHFLPSVVSILLIGPFYFLRPAEKLAFIETFLHDKNYLFTAKIGYLSNMWHFIARPVQGVIYVVFQLCLLRNYLFKRMKLRDAGYLVFRSPARWLVVLTLLETACYGLLAIATTHGYLHLYSGQDLMRLENLSLVLGSIVFFWITVYLFFNPDILYGENILFNLVFNISDKPAPQPQENKKIASPLSDSAINQYAQRLEQLITGQELFRARGITINQLSEKAGISPRNLSYLLNNHYEQRFSDFINDYRVRYIKKRMESSDWKELTLEGLAREAGFSSRSAFFSAFKKFTGMNPSDYLQSRVRGPS